MFWCSRCFGAVDVLVQSMFCSSRCYGSMFWRGRCFGVVDILVWLMFWCGRCFGVVDILVCLMFWCDRCFSAVEVLAQSIFEVPQGMSHTSQLMFQHGQCFGTFKFWGPSENVKAQAFINEGNEHLTSLQSPNFSRSVLNIFNMKHLPSFYNIKKKIWPINYIFC